MARKMKKRDVNFLKCLKIRENSYFFKTFICEILDDGSIMNDIFDILRNQKLELIIDRQVLMKCQKTRPKESKQKVALKTFFQRHLYIFFLEKTQGS